MRVINDTHIGAIRSAGTTAVSQLALRKHILASFQKLLPTTGDLLILGDLFDSYSAPMNDVLTTYEHLADWLHEHPTAALYNAAGNHDLSRTSNVMSSFQFLGRLLSRQFPARYFHIEQPTAIPYGYVIPHLANQDAFNQALEAMPQTKRLFLHCNLGNKFAETADQSLNLSLPVLDTLPCNEVILGHEHKYRRVGKAVVIGNQIATSVADWLGPDKYYADIGLSTELHCCAEKQKEFIQQDWRELEVTDHKFVRVIGTVPTVEATLAVTAVAKFRGISPALVIANAVEIEIEGSAAEFASSLESVQSFDVMQALGKHLTSEQFTKIQTLL